MSGLACSIPEAVRTVEELCQVSQHQHHHHHHYNRHHHPRNKLADQAELFNPNGGDRFWPEHFWPMSRSSQVCRGMFLIIRNLKYFDTIQTFLIRQNWGVKKTMFTLLFYSYFQIYFLCSTHCIGFNTAHIVPFDQEISRGLQDLPRLCFWANLWSQGNLSVFGTEPLTAFQNMSPPLVKEIHYHQPAHRWLTSVAQQLLCPGKYVEQPPRYSY